MESVIEKPRLSSHVEAERYQILARRLLRPKLGRAAGLLDSEKGDPNPSSSEKEDRTAVCKSSNELLRLYTRFTIIIAKQSLNHYMSMFKIPFIT